MRAWEEQSATVDTTDPRGAFAASYRLAETTAVSGGGGAGAGITVTATEVPREKDQVQEQERSRPTSRLWIEWSTADFASADLTNAVAILPLGAVEAHGPHLPLGVDAIHNHELLRSTLELLPSPEEYSETKTFLSHVARLSYWIL